MSDNDGDDDDAIPKLMLLLLLFVNTPAEDDEPALKKEDALLAVDDDDLLDAVMRELFRVIRLDRIACREHDAAKDLPTVENIFSDVVLFVEILGAEMKKVRASGGSGYLAQIWLSGSQVGLWL